MKQTTKDKLARVQKKIGTKTQEETILILIKLFNAFKLHEEARELK